MLLGTDLEKSHAQMIAAYGDELGVTPAFNLNLLARINRELDADFDLSQFQHVARFNREVRSIEMHLRSKRNQSVTIPGSELVVEFVEGETIWTESSHKYATTEVSRLAQSAGFRCRAQWVDEQWPFAESLLVAE